MKSADRVLESAKGTAYDRYGHYGPAGVQVDTTIELVEDRGGFEVRTTMPDGRVIVDSAEDEADGKAMFSLMPLAGPCPEIARRSP